MFSKKFKNFDILLISFFITFILYLIQIRLSFGLWDEGFLWYGVQRTMLLEVPIRDFMAYDPGRYYWCASIMTLLGSSSIIALRISIGIVQLVGVYLCLKILKENYKNEYRSLFLIFCSIIISLWMIPQHKVFDIVCSILVFYSLYRYGEEITEKRALCLGITIGFVAVWGRNHGVYGLLSSILVIVFYGIYNKNEIKNKFKFFIIGIILGYLPILIMLLFFDGFFKEFIDSILFLFSQGKTNITLPIPWLWDINYNSVTLKEILVSILFTFMPLYSCIGIVFLIKNANVNNKVSLIVSSVFLNIVYIHFAFSRADLSHLSQSIFPMLLGLLYLVSKVKNIYLLSMLTILMLVFSNDIMLPRHPIYSYLFGSNKKIDIGNQEISVGKKAAYDVKFIKKSIEDLSSDDEILIVPYWPGAYALLGKKSPVWENYALFERTDNFQYRELERIKSVKPKIIILNNSILDNDKRNKYENTHKVIYSYIVNNYDLIREIKSKKYYVYRVRD